MPTLQVCVSAEDAAKIKAIKERDKCTVTAAFHAFFNLSGGIHKGRPMSPSLRLPFLKRYKSAGDWFAYLTELYKIPVAERGPHYPERLQEPYVGDWLNTIEGMVRAKGMTPPRDTFRWGPAPIPTQPTPATKRGKKATE